ncbi:MAG: putative porin [Gammaproteobacteria bacterium]|nr:putative porin [Gammaproteobacteria bacterium]
MNNYRHVAARAVLAVMALGSCAAQGAASVPLPAVSPAAPSWTEKVTLQGDLRYRYENIDVEQADSERNRQRIRARAAIIAKPEDRLEVGFGLSTSENGDPISSNQTIGSGGSRKDIYLDLAYFNWNALQGLNVVGGKYKNFLYRPGKHSLLWDGDWNPEGLGLIYARGPFFANLIGTWLESDSNKAEEFTFGGQVGASQVLGDDVKVTGGVGYFRSNTAGKPTFFGGTTAFSGNSFDALNNVYLYDYEEVEVFGEIAFMMGELPVSLFADFVQNQDADRFDTGWAAGVQLGTAKKKGGWEAGYAYQDLEPDAVLGLLTDSDFGGGGTDNKGHVIRGAYALSDKWNVAGSYFINTIDEYSGTRRDYDRLQLDLNVRY